MTPPGRSRAGTSPLREEPPADTWTPTADQTAYLRSTGESVRVMDFREERMYVRPLRGGRERALRVCELIPPDDAPGGLHDWQASRG